MGRGILPINPRTPRPALARHLPPDLYCALYHAAPCTSCADFSQSLYVVRQCDTCYTDYCISVAAYTKMFFFTTWTVLDRTVPDSATEAEAAARVDSLMRPLLRFDGISWPGGSARAIMENTKAYGEIWQGDLRYFPTARPNPNVEPLPLGPGPADVPADAPAHGPDGGPVGRGSEEEEIHETIPDVLMSTL